LQQGSLARVSQPSASRSVTSAAAGERAPRLAGLGAGLEPEIHRVDP
jgi:hypothetical protein